MLDDFVMDPTDSPLGFRLFKDPVSLCPVTSIAADRRAGELGVLRGDRGVLAGDRVFLATRDRGVLKHNFIQKFE